ncbi:ComEC/Rec2 family competence protein [Ectobacillus antri]|uniref:ComEC/Rec2 family competence protein n=1 Tax=Ectobacillus antri TaxID=2486280 RepID=UPI00360C39A2
MKLVRISMHCLIFIICFCLFGVSYASYSPSMPVMRVARESQRTPLTVTFLKVGQGDSTLLSLPNGKHILIDGGPHEAGEAVIHKLIEKRIKKLDLVISTHPDMDHIGGLIQVIQQVPVTMILDSGKHYYSLTYRMYIRSVKERKIPFIAAKEGQFLPLDPNISIRVLNDGKKKDANNESSIVLQVRYNKADFLLMGDADVATEKRIIDRYSVHADVLKIGHHGSYTSSSARLLTSANPQFVVLSYGKGNPYGHPHQSVMKRLRKYGMQVYSTVSGDIEFQTDGSNIVINRKTPLPLLK